jgi:hypothetical protein
MGETQKKKEEKYLCKRLIFGANPLWVEPPVGSLPITRQALPLDPVLLFPLVEPRIQHDFGFLIGLGWLPQRGADSVGHPAPLSSCAN